MKCVFLRLTHCKSCNDLLKLRFCGCFSFAFSLDRLIECVVFSLFLLGVSVLTSSCSPVPHSPPHPLPSSSFWFVFANAFRFCQVSRHFTSTYLDLLSFVVCANWSRVVHFADVDPRDVLHGAVPRSYYIS